MASLPANSTYFVDQIRKPFGADEDIRIVFLWTYAYHTDGTKTKLGTNYPQFTLEGSEVVDVQADELFFIICQPTSRTGAPRFPKFMEVIEWIQAMVKT
eukprot:7240575-Heterocapsa_arctica.AAC.1